MLLRRHKKTEKNSASKDIKENHAKEVKNIVNTDEPKKKVKH